MPSRTYERFRTAIENTSSNVNGGTEKHDRGNRFHRCEVVVEVDWRLCLPRFHVLFPKHRLGVLWLGKRFERRSPVQ